MKWSPKNPKYGSLKSNLLSLDKKCIGELGLNCGEGRRGRNETLLSKISAVQNAQLSFLSKPHYLQNLSNQLSKNKTTVVNDIKVRHYLKFYLPSLVGMFWILFITTLINNKFQISLNFGTFQNISNHFKVSDLATMIVLPTQKTVKIKTNKTCKLILGSGQAFGARPSLVKTASKVGWA